MLWCIYTSYWKRFIFIFIQLVYTFPNFLETPCTYGQHTAQEGWCKTHFLPLCIAYEQTYNIYIYIYIYIYIQCMCMSTVYLLGWNESWIQVRKSRLVQDVYSFNYTNGLFICTMTAWRHYSLPLKTNGFSRFIIRSWYNKTVHNVFHWKTSESILRSNTYGSGKVENSENVYNAWELYTVTVHCIQCPRYIGQCKLWSIYTK
jgi:hypothetical protein